MFVCATCVENSLLTAQMSHYPCGCA